MEEIWKRKNCRTITITSILKEGNQLAEHLANVALEKREINVESFQNLGVQ